MSASNGEQNFCNKLCSSLQQEHNSSHKNKRATFWWRIMFVYKNIVSFIHKPFESPGDGTGGENFAFLIVE